MSATSAQPHHALVAGTLASLSYVKPDGSSQKQASIIQKALANPQLPTQNQWQLAWGPETVDGNLSYVATGSDNKLAYVIRGTVLAAWNIIEDISVLSLDKLPWHAPEFPDAKISSGAIDGWEDLTKHGHNGWDAYLKDHLASGSELFVIGHSLGGMLASVMGAYFFSQAAQAKLNATVQLYTFAGQTAGNQAFADQVSQKLGGAGRYFNDLDVVPKAFNHDDLASVRKLYPGADSPKCDLLNGCKEGVALAQAEAGHSYFQPPGGSQLQSRVYNESGE